MADSSTPPAATSELPDIFTPMQPLLLLLSIGSQALFSRPNDPLPQALAQLTDYNLEAATQVQAITDSEGLYELLHQEPEVFANYLLLGFLTYASPLGSSLAQRLTPADDPDNGASVAERQAELLGFVAHHAAWQSELIETFLLARYDEEDRAEAARERADFRAGIEAAFADWQHSLGALLLEAPAPAVPLDGSGWLLTPQQIQLDTLKMAVLVMRSLPDLSDHPFGQAVQRLPDFHPQRLEELGEYLGAAPADEPLELSRAQGLLLYIAAHVGTLLFINDLLNGEGLDDLLLRRRADDDDITPDLVDKLRHATTIMLGGYIDLIREHESDSDDFRVLEARLAPVLALGAE